MTKFYATRDFDGERIEENATIQAFDSRVSAETYLRHGWHLDPGDTLAIENGEFSDCWIKMHRRPVVGDSAFAPFTYTDVIIQKPGQHPGGNVYWLTPSREILVARHDVAA